MRVYGDYHVHTTHSDGRCGIKKLLEHANRCELCELAITDHSFASTIFHMTERKLARQRRVLKAYEGSVRVLSGIEANIVNAQGDIDIPDDVIRGLDVLTIGFHRFIGFKGERRGGYDRRWLFTNGFCSKGARQMLKERNTQAYISAMSKFPVDIVAHLNHRALVDVKKVCEAAASKGVYVELNEKHIDVLCEYAQDIVDSGVRLLVGTDAHSAKKLGKMKKIETFVKKYSIPQDRVYGLDGRAPSFKNKKDWTIG